jgi:hypothetical protein
MEKVDRRERKEIMTAGTLGDERKKIRGCR